MNYLEWNEAIYKHYFVHNIVGRKIVLSANSRVLKLLGSKLENPIEDFTEAIRTGPLPKSRFNFEPGIIGWKKQDAFNIIERAIWLKICWRAEPKKYNIEKGKTRGGHIIIWPDNYPPYLAYLFFLILKVEDDEKSYWQSLNHYLCLNEKLGSNDGKNLICLFEDLKKYNNDFYYCNIYHSGGRPYVGTLYSQLPLNKEEEESIVKQFKYEQISSDQITIENGWNDDALIDFLLGITTSLNPVTESVLSENGEPQLRQIIIDYYLNNLKSFDWDIEIDIESLEEKRNKQIVPLRLFLNYNSNDGYRVSLKCQSNAFETLNNQSLSNLKVKDAGKVLAIGTKYTSDVHFFDFDANLENVNLKVNYLDIDGQEHTRSLKFDKVNYYIFEKYQVGEYAQLGEHQSLLKKKEYYILFERSDTVVESFRKGFEEILNCGELNGFLLLKFKNPNSSIGYHKLRSDISFREIGDRDIDFLKDNKAFLSTGLPQIQATNIQKNSNLVLEIEGRKSHETFLTEPEFNIDLNKSKYRDRLQGTKNITLYIQNKSDVKKQFTVKLPSIPDEVKNSSLLEDFTIKNQVLPLFQHTLNINELKPDFYFDKGEQFLYTISNYKSLTYHRLKKIVRYFINKRSDNEAIKDDQQRIEQNISKIIEQLASLNYVRLVKNNKLIIAIPNTPHLVPLNLKDSKKNYFFLSGARDRDFLCDFVKWLKSVNVSFGYIKQNNGFLVQFMPYSIVVNPGNSMFFALLENSKYKHLIRYRFLENINCPNQRCIPYMNFIKLPSIDKIQEVTNYEPGEVHYKVFSSDLTTVNSRIINLIDETLLGYCGNYDKKYFVYFDHQVHIYEHRSWAFYKYIQIKGMNDLLIYDSINCILAVPDFIGLPSDFQRFLVLATGLQPKNIFVKNKFMPGKNGKPTFFMDTESIKLEPKSISSYTLYFTISEDLIKILKEKLKIDCKELALDELLKN